METYVHRPGFLAFRGALRGGAACRDHVAVRGTAVRHIFYNGAEGLLCKAGLLSVAGHRCSAVERFLPAGMEERISEGWIWSRIVSCNVSNSDSACRYHVKNKWKGGMMT